jgi:hypothetical protein
MIRKISVAFAGGALGGLVDSFNIWFMGKVGVSDLIGLTMKPEFTAPWLYQRMVWGRSLDAFAPAAATAEKASCGCLLQSSAVGHDALPGTAGDGQGGSGAGFSAWSHQLL